MAVKFTPTGLLDIATDPTALPAQNNGKMEVSGAMVRCKNLSTVDNGVAVTRKGSTVIASPVSETTPKLLIEHSGDRYLFSGTTLYRDEVSIATDLTAAKWRGVLYNAYNVTTQSLFALNGTDRKRITGSTVAEWGLDAPTVAPTLAGIDYVYTYDWETDNVTGHTRKLTETDTVNSLEYVYGWEEFYADDIADHPDVTTAANTACYYFENSTVGTFMITYTYCRKSTDADGNEILEAESNPYLPTAVDEDGNTDWTELEIVQYSGLALTWTAATDSQVTHVRVYRSLIDEGVFYYDTEYAVGDLTAVLTLEDSLLGAIVETDNDRPPATATVVMGPVFNGYCFALDANLLYYSKANKPESWPALNYVEVGAPQFELTAAVFAGGILYVMNRTEMYSVQGTGSASFFPYPVNATTGAVSQEGVIAIKGQGIFRVASDGIWVFTGSEDKKFSQDRFDPIFRGEAKHGVPAVNTTYIENAWLFQYKNFLYFGYPGDAATLPDSLIVINLNNAKASYYDYGQTFPCIAIDRTNDRIIAADNAGQIWQLETGTNDNGTTISWELESKAFSDSLYKYFPRYAKYDVDGTATGSILLDDEVKQTHAITSRNTKKRHIAGVTGNRLGVRLSGSGSITIRQVEIE